MLFLGQLKHSLCWFLVIFKFRLLLLFLFLSSQRNHRKDQQQHCRLSWTGQSLQNRYLVQADASPAGCCGVHCQVLPTRAPSPSCSSTSGWWTVDFGGSGWWSPDFPLHSAAFFLPVWCPVPCTQRCTRLEAPRCSALLGPFWGLSPVHLCAWPA